MSCPRLVAVVSATLVVGCNLVVSLDDLQDGAGGASSGSQAIGTAASATLSATASASATNASSTAAATGGGGGGEVPGYDDCVEALGPVVRLRLDGAAGDSEMNFGSWGGSAGYTGTRNAEAPLAAGSPAASFAPDGSLSLPALSGFFGGAQAFTIELWFRPPMDYSEEVVALLAGTDGFVLRLEERFDTMGLDAIRFRFFGAGGATDRVALENFDFAGGGIHHVVAVYQEAPLMNGDGEDLQIFVDGVAPVNLATGTDSTMPALDGSLTFGNGFAGPVDELSIYPAALSPAAIEALHALGMGQSATCPTQ
jgi:hypothetical protein